MLHNNIKKDGSLDTDRFAAALMTKRNIPEYGSKLSPAEIVMGKGKNYETLSQCYLRM